MALRVEVVCTDLNARPRVSEEKRMQVIGEILPFVLAKYGAKAFSRPRGPQEPRPNLRRFAR
jgi:hypothetical protein